MQNAIAAARGGRHRVGAARGRIFGEYPRSSKWRSMSVFPARIASWTGEDVQRAEWVRSAGSCGGVESTLHQDSSGRAART